MCCCFSLVMFSQSLKMDKNSARLVNTSYYNTNYQYTNVNKEGKCLNIKYLNNSIFTQLDVLIIPNKGMWSSIFSHFVTSHYYVQQHSSRVLKTGNLVQSHFWVQSTIYSHVKYVLRLSCDKNVSNRVLILIICRLITLLVTSFVWILYVFLQKATAQNKTTADKFMSSLYELQSFTPRFIGDIQSSCVQTNFYLLILQYSH